MVDSENTRWLDFGAQESSSERDRTCSERSDVASRVLFRRASARHDNFYLAEYRCEQDFRYSAATKEEKCPT